MKAKEFANDHLIPTLKTLCGAEWKGRLTERLYNHHTVFEVSGVENGGPLHAALRDLAPRTHRCLLGNKSYSFVVDR